MTAADRLRPWLTYPAWGCSLALLVLAPLFPTLALRFQYLPFAVGLVLLGLPHGAMDHLAIPHLTCRPLTWRFALPFFGGYLGLVLLYLAFWHTAPAAALVVFLLVSCLHWGQGDLAFLCLFEGRPRPNSPLDALTVWVVRGGLPILLPILAFPNTFAYVAAGLTAWYGGLGLPAPGRGIVTTGLLAFAVLLGLYVVQYWRECGPARRGAFRRDVGELALLAALFWRVPPVLAVGVYFCVWHSARHIGRLMLADPVTAGLLARGRLWQGAVRTAGQSLPLTVAALALLTGLYAVQRHQSVALTLPNMVFLYLSLIAALTVPHFLLVLWMDHRQRVSWVTSDNGPLA